MIFLDVLRSALSALMNGWDNVEVELSRAAQEALDSRLQGAAQNKTRHPLLSSTPLPEAMRRALANVSRLEAKYEKTFRDATTGLLAIEQAKQFLLRLESADRLKKDQDREKDATGLYEESRRFVDHLYGYGAAKWHLAQQSLKEVRIYADLIKWKAKDPEHEQLDTPWRSLLEQYKRRKIEVDIVGKFSLSVPRETTPEATHVTLIPSYDELQKLVAGWGILVPPGDHARAEKPGRVENDGPFDGIIFAAHSQIKSIPMWARKAHISDVPWELSRRDWFKFEVPRGPYALVQLPHSLPLYDARSTSAFPPFSTLHLYGVQADFSEREIRELKEVAEGNGPTEIAIRAVREGVISAFRSDDEDLVRFWLFLLIGRHFMDRIDELFPEGYFHGVVAPDSGAMAEGGEGSFAIVRIANDGNLGKSLRPVRFGPWSNQSSPSRDA